MTVRLPTPGGDNGDWGTILNDFLEVSHNNDGTLQPNAIRQAGGVTTNTTAGGDLEGSYPNPTVARVNGISVSGIPGVGQVLTATGASTASWQAASSNTTVGQLTVHKAPFAYNLAGLDEGATAPFTDGYIPAVGDILYDAWIEIDTAWNGMSPQGDIIQSGGDAGLFRTLNSAIDMTQIWDQDIFGSGLLASEGGPISSFAAARVFSSLFIPTPNVVFVGLGDPSGNTNYNAAAAGALYIDTQNGVYYQAQAPGYSNWTFAGSGCSIGAVTIDANDSYVSAPPTFTTTDPIQIVVSQSGAIRGGDPRSTQGSAILYLVTATP